MAELTILPNTTTSLLHGQTTLGAASDAITINVGGTADFMGVQINAGLTGTITYTGSVDGTTFSAIQGTNIDATAGSLTDTTFGKVKVFDVRPLQFIRLQITAFTSGSSLLIWTVNLVGK